MSVPPLEDTVPRPRALQVRASGIPHELRKRDQWVTWGYTWDGAKYDKPPYQATGDALASSTEPATWSSFAKALSRADKPDRDGVGYVVSPSDPYTIDDLDHCRDPKTSEIVSDAIAIMDALGGYWEASPSGTGLRGVVRAKLPGA